MMKIDVVLGKTKHGATIRLVRTLTGEWEFHKDPAEQRDDHVFVSGLSAELLLRVGEQVANVEKLLKDKP